MPHPTPTDPLVGSSLDDTYEIVRVVAEGGMGRVYEARHKRIRTKRLAIKVIHPELLRNPEIVARFQREVEASAAISSPHVAGVYDVGRTQTSQPYLVAEFLEGRDLAEFLETFPKLPVGFSVRVVRQACRGLAAAHKSDIVHRDIKPENIFLTGDQRRPHVKVVDFGISRLDDGQAKNLTQTGVVIGTPAFMPPEQAKGARVDHRADVYAAGAVLYTMLTGHDPFVSESSAETLFAVLTREPTAPRELEPSIPVHLEAIIQKAMAKEPEDRYPTIDAFADALIPYDPDESVHVDFPGDPSSPDTAAPASAEEAAARTARTSLTMLLTIATAWLVAGLISIGGAMVRMTSGPGARLTEIEANLLILAVFAALLTPSALGLRRLAKDVWPNTAKVVAWVSRLRAPIAATVASYGMLALLVRTLEAVWLRHASNVAWPGWDLTLVLISAGVGLAVYFAPAARTRLPAPTLTTLETLPAAVPASAAVMATVLLLAGTLALRGDDHVSTASNDATTEVATGSTVTKAAADNGSEEDAGPPIDPDALAPADAVETARTQGSASIAALTERYPQDPSVHRALALAHASATPPDYLAAIASVQRAVALAPRLGSDTALRELIKAATLSTVDVRDAAAKLVTDHMGTSGLDLAFESVVANDAFASQAEQILADPKRRERATPALQVAWDLRQASSCDDKVALLDRAKRDGDQRSVDELNAVARGKSRGCGFLGSRACPPKCRKQAKAMRTAIADIESRLGEG